MARKNKDIKILSNDDKLKKAEKSGRYPASKTMHIEKGKKYNAIKLDPKDKGRPRVEIRKKDVIDYLDSHPEIKAELSPKLKVADVSQFVSELSDEVFEALVNAIEQQSV